MSERLRGFVLAFCAFAVIFLGWKVVDEYRYYQVVKKEHQAFFHDEFGRTADGKVFTRKMFFDAMVAESAKAQAEKAQSARKE